MDDDSRLTELFDEPPIADDGFSAAVMARVRRRRTVRRALLAVIALLAAVAGWLLLPPEAIRWPAVAIDPWHLLIALIVLGVVGAVWVDSEPLGLPD